MSTLKVKDETTALRDILILLFFLVTNLLLLFYLYKKLNRDTNGQYTVRQLVYKEGGVRDRVRGWVGVLETRLGRRLWPLSVEEEGGGEEEHDRDRGFALEGGSEEGESESEGEEEESEEDDSSDDYSSVNLRERVNEMKEGEMEDKEKSEEEGKKGEAREDGDVKVEVEGGGGGLLIDLKQFSGSAIWSEEEREDKGNNVTVL